MIIWIDLFWVFTVLVFNASYTIVSIHNLTFWNRHVKELAQKTQSFTAFSSSTENIEIVYAFIS